jgi:ribosomal protein S12 methylthiotransferase accessory factor
MNAEDLLVDPRLGLITSLTRHDRRPGMPPAWIGYGASVARTTAYAPWETDRYGFGAALGDPDRARRAALGEAVERYCGNIVPDELRTASFNELTSAGLDAVDPEDLALYSPRQHATPGFPFVPFTRDLRVAWTGGRDMRTGAEVLVPASLAYLNYFRGAHADEPATNALSFAGIATGEDRGHAERFALEELFERDASTIWWMTGASAPVVADGDKVIGLLDDPDADQRIVRLLALPSPFGVPVMAVFIEDHRLRMIAFGSACRADAEEASTKALVEAYGLLGLTMQLADPGSDVWRARDDGSIGSHVFRPFRAERDYASVIRPDFRDLTDLPAVAQLYLDPQMQGEPLDRLRADDPVIRLADIPAAAPRNAAPYNNAAPDHNAGPDRNEAPNGNAGPNHNAGPNGNTGPEHSGLRDCYVSRLYQAGLRAVSVDLTTPDVRAAGLCVVRVIVPGLYGNAAAAFPYLGGARLYQHVGEDDLVRHPIPLA